MKVLELFSGIGAAAVALAERADIACAIDINQSAMAVYRSNFNSPTLVQEISSLTDQRLAEFGADLWWMSPPCQPFTRRGLQKDLDDSRSRPLLRLLSAIERVRPSRLVLENVIGFEGSQACAQLIRTLERTGYDYATCELCSTQFGLPNLRPRFFLVASLESQPTLTPPRNAVQRQPIAGFLDIETDRVRWNGHLQVEPTLLEEYRTAVNIVLPNSELSRCFTSAYGRSIVRSGSYLAIDGGFRRFSPSEECRLLGFPREFRLPTTMGVNELWKLLGNTVSIPCAEHALQSLGIYRMPELIPGTGSCSN